MFGMLQFTVYMLAIIGFILASILDHQRLMAAAPDENSKRALGWRDTLWAIATRLAIVGILIWMEGFVSTTAMTLK